jgi:polyisoprenoid-binding protein YceI
MSRTTAPSVIPTGTWDVDPAHSRVGFSIRHMGIATVRGEFDEFAGTLEVNSEPAAGRASGSVSAASIFTNQPQRDEHLRSPDFFDVAAHPTIRFVSTAIEVVAAQTFDISGELTIRGVSRTVTLRAVIHGSDVDLFGQTRVGLAVTGEISRSDYGMTFNQTLSSGGLLLSDRVHITVDISAVKQG